MKAKHFIWDFDGTIIDTYPHTTTAFMETAKKHNINASYDEAMVHLRHSLSGAKAIYKLSDEVFDSFIERALELWFEPIPVPYNGIEAVLEKIVLAGGKNFIYTNRDITAVKYLEHYGLAKYFTDYVYNTSPAYAKKPAPDSVEYIVKKYSLYKDEVAMVGDREIDVLSGKNAGCKAILFDEFHISDNTAADATIYDITKVADYIK